MNLTKIYPVTKTLKEAFLKEFEENIDKIKAEILQDIPFSKRKKLLKKINYICKKEIL